MSSYRAKPRKPHWTVLALFLLLFFYHSPCQGAEKLVLVSSTDFKSSPYGKRLALVYGEVCKRLGYELDYQGYPSERAAQLVDQGEADGEICRPADYGASRPNRVRMEEPLFMQNFSAFAVRPGISLEGWDSLKGAPYRVDYRIGIPKPQAALPRIVPPERLTGVTSPEQGLRKLVAERTDIYIDSELIVMDALTRLRASGQAMAGVYNAGVMESVEMYSFFAAKHARALVPEIARTIRELKREGLFDDFLGQALTGN